VSFKPDRFVSLFSRRIVVPLILPWLLLSGFAQADIEGTVVRIFDGDTVEIKDASDNLYRIRLEGIDAPERTQAFSARSREALADLVFSRKVKAVTSGVDTYGRHLAHLYIDGTWVNREMVRRGMAWHYKYFNKDTRLANSEIYARNNQLGLWADPAPVPPWVFRQQQKQEKNRTENGETGSYWLNTSSGVRHNSSCRHFMNTRRGRLCRQDEGTPCGECGG